MRASLFLLSVLMTSSVWANNTCNSDAIYIYTEYHWHYTSEIYLSKEEITDDVRRSDLREAVVAKSPTKGKSTWDNRDTMLTWLANAKLKRDMPKNLGANVASLLKDTHDLIFPMESKSKGPGPVGYSGKMKLDILTGNGQIEAKEFTFSVADEKLHQGYNQIKIEGDCTEDLYNNLRPLFKTANKARPMLEPLKDIIADSIIFQIISQM